ncbi:hypothetical protein LINGRAHAP2_LOCUS13590 [Linum grandiflorum]
MDSAIFTLNNLPKGRPEGVVYLRLLNTWKVGNPAKPENFFAFGTLRTDEEGTIVEGISHRGHTEVMAARLAVRFVYKAVSISDPEYVDATHGIALTQSVVLRATTSARLTVTLWADFAKVLDPFVLAIENASSPVVIAFSGLIV